jgi:hypothetical protein
MIRLIEVAHGRTQDAVTVVRMAFLRSSCGTDFGLLVVAKFQSVIMLE